MHLIDFESRLTAMEIREPMMEVCKEIAQDEGIYVTLRQRQQAALAGSPGQRRRERIGNAKHKTWTINYQIDPENVDNPRSVGRIHVASHVNPAERQYGGFDYGKYGVEPKPSYPHITLQTPSELGVYRPIDPTPTVLQMTFDGLRNRFQNGQGRLFPMDPFVGQPRYL